MEEREKYDGFYDGYTPEEQLQIIKERIKELDRLGVPSKTWEEIKQEIEKFSKENDNTTL